MKQLYRRLQSFNGHKHVLYNVAALVQLGDGLGLRQFQQGHLRWHQPAQRVAEQGVVAEWYDVLGRKVGFRGRYLA